MWRLSTLPALLALVSLSLTACPAPEHPYPVRDCRTELRYAPQASIEGEVQLLGEWNGFAGLPMQRNDDGTWHAHVSLEPRDYGYRFLVGGQQVLDPENPYTRWVGNEEYSRVVVRDCKLPSLELVSFRQPAHGSVEVTAQFIDGAERLGPSDEHATLTLNGEAVQGAFDAATGRFTFTKEDLPNGKHHIRINVSDTEGRAAPELYLPFWVEETPFDWQEAILYFAFTDRFRNGNPQNDSQLANVAPQANYLGGDFEGIRQAIEEGYFDKLGVRAIWLSPVVKNPDGAFPGSHGQQYTGYHGYWPSAARETQRRFGAMEELKALTRAAHARGIRVITDLVINHVHDEHPYYAEHKQDGWFNVSNACVCGLNCDWEARRLDCWFTDYLPDLNWRSTQLVDQMTEDALYWLKEADLDGFRLDAVKHLDHVGGRTIAGKLNEISAQTGVDFYLVGETFTGTEGRPLIAEYIGPNELDGQFDFPLYWPVLDAFAKGGSLTLVDQAVVANEAFYAPEALNSPFAGNHDVPRFISIAAGQVEENSGGQAWGPNKPPATVDTDEPFRKTRDALTFVLTLPGVPLLYYGDEIGLPGTGDPDNRRLMKWGTELSPREAALLEHVQKVGTARRQNRGLRFGARYTLVAQTDTLVYQRDDATGTDGALVAIHRGAQDTTMTVSLKGRLKGANGQTFKDVISGRTATVVDGQISLDLPAQSAGVWIPQS